MARRFAEAGVRFIQCTHSYKWDQHGNLNATTARMRVKWTVPLLVFCATSSSAACSMTPWCCGEASLDAPRRPRWQRSRPQPPCLHHVDGRRRCQTWFSFAATDEWGYYAQDNKVHVHDLHATILALLGLNHERLTYRHAGRDFRLTDVEGRVVRELFA